MQFLALNGGPHFQLNEAFSLSIDCQSQAEVDDLWEKLSAGGSKSQCGWLKDRYGLSWQVVPDVLPKLLADPDRAKAGRVMEAMMGMTKLDIQALQAAADAKYGDRRTTGDAMKYMLLMYGAESQWTDAERTACMVESLGVCDELAAQGKFLAASPLQSVDDGRDRPRAGRPAAGHRRPVRRDDGATRRLLRARPRRPRRGDRGRQPAPARRARGPSRSARCSPSTACRRRGRSRRPSDPAGTPYLLLCYDDEAAWQAAGPAAMRAAMAEAAALARELNDAGQYLSASPLHPAATATCVRVRDGKREITDGPFAETHEVLGGFYLILAESRDAALRVAAQHPGARLGAVEVRPLFDLSGLRKSPRFREPLSISGPPVRPLGERRATDRPQTPTSGETMTGTTITPYLFFGGRCDEALAFYRTALGAEVEMLMRFDESPEPPPPGMLQAGFEKKVMHASFRVRGVPLMASDGCDDRVRSSTASGSPSPSRPRRTPSRRSTPWPTAAACRCRSTKTFWSPCYGMVTDRFGLGWMVMVPGPTG